jgi:hypothetical protein
MRRILLSLFVAVLGTISVFAQYDEYNSLAREAMVYYSRDAKGFYKRFTGVQLPKVWSVEKQYAFNKKENILYVLTPNANVAIVLDKYHSKVIKKNKSIPQLKSKELDAAIAMSTSLLDKKFQRLNDQRIQYIRDSTEKARADSIERVREYERQQEAKRQAEESYRRSHSYHFVPTGDATLSCTLCDNTFEKDSLWCLGIKNDSIYFLTREDGALGLTLVEAHAASMPYSLTSNDDFIYHTKVFADSLTNDTVDYPGLCNYMNYVNGTKYLSQLRRMAPYGFVKTWSWDDEYSMVTFNLGYTNTNPKTIRYISVYFKITNDVGDVRCTGVFRGTGPVKQWDSASWDWDSSSYFVSGDASKMRITKIVLTWMNGKQQVVSGRYLQFDDDDDDTSDNDYDNDDTSDDYDL